MRVAVGVRNSLRTPIALCQEAAFNRQSPAPDLNKTYTPYTRAAAADLVYGTSPYIQAAVAATARFGGRLPLLGDSCLQDCPS